MKGRFSFVTVESRANIPATSESMVELISKAYLCARADVLKIDILV